jgi:hypothetical protein
VLHGARRWPLASRATANGEARQKSEGFRIDVDLEHARREGERVHALLMALRRRHDLSRFEYTRIVRIVPGGDTFAHPILTLGNRFAGNEDLLLSTYLHEQMHWYLWHLGTPEHDPVAPFFDELVKRYPGAPTTLPDGARNYESTYLHLVINWLEVAATSELIGRPRACAVADQSHTYRWIYRTVLQDWDMLAELYERHGILPIRSAQELEKESVKSGRGPLSGATRRTRAATRQIAPPRVRRGPPARGGRSVG